MLDNRYEINNIILSLKVEKGMLCDSIMELANGLSAEVTGGARLHDTLLALQLKQATSLHPHHVYP